MGKADGIVVDAWFTGFAEGKEGMIYFCVYLGESEGIGSLDIWKKKNIFTSLPPISRTIALPPAKLPQTLRFPFFPA